MGPSLPLYLQFSTVNKWSVQWLPVTNVSINTAHADWSLLCDDWVHKRLSTYEASEWQLIFFITRYFIFVQVCAQQHSRSCTHTHC